MKKFNRREFLKIGSIGVTALSAQSLFGGIIPVVGNKGRNVSKFTSDFRQGIPTICNLCPAKCGVIGFLRYDHLVAIQGNPYHLNNQGKICARGIAGVNQVYNPDRILHPLKRIGKRGEHKWEKISWEEALTQISNRLKTLKTENRADQFTLHADRQHLTGLTKRFVESYGEPTLLTTSYQTDFNREAALKSIYGTDRVIADAAHARYFLFFGSNPFESHPDFVSFNHRMIESKMQNNARIVTIDPRLSNTAGRSDQWIPIKPGTDAIVALAMANVIMQKELYDADFINQFTDVSVSQLRSHLSQYSVQRAADESMIKTETIEKIAVDFAENQPGVVISGGGLTKQSNGFESERAIQLLNIIVGNIDQKGGMCLPQQYQISDFVPAEIDTDPNGYQFFNELKAGQRQTDFYFSYMSNPVYEYPDCENTKAVFKDEEAMPFTVVMDTVMSETAALADIILPATTFVENWSLDTSPSYEFVPFIALAQPVIKPQGEARSLDSVFLEVAKHIGDAVQNNLNYASVENYFEYTLKNLDVVSKSIDLKKLKKEGIYFDSESRPRYGINRQRGFQTSNGRIFIDGREVSLPGYVPIEQNRDLAENELILTPYKYNVMRPDLTNLKLLTEIHHSNHAIMNALTARRLRIKHEDYIELESAVRKIVLKVHLTEGIHPDAVAISEGLGHWEYGRIAQAQRFKSDDPDTNFIWWHKKGKGMHPNFVIPVAVDPKGNGQGWKSTKVKVRKV